MNDEECGLCLDVMRDRLDLPCGHSFCCACLDEQFKKMQIEGDFNERCGYCRAPLFGDATLLFGEAMQLLQTLTAADPRDAAAVATLRDAAIVAFERSQRAAEPYATGPDGLNRIATAAQYNIGQTLELTGDWAGASTAYRAAVAMNSREHMAICNLGTAIYKSSDGAMVQEARAMWSRALELAPDDDVARTNLEATADEVT
mmetsp:Transcript_8038/g.26712  ORF Transcript_8038/g.26712 Transcript_8038/m.26712 type:complete len:202 (+) Transcript_8038:49-654(+)